MASNVLINFTADTGGLDQTNQKLEALIGKEKELKQEIANLNQELDNAYGVNGGQKKAVDFGKTIESLKGKITNTEKDLKRTTRSISELFNAQKNIEKQIVNSNIEKTFKAQRYELENQLRLLRLNGQVGTEEYEKVRQKLTELNVVQREVTAELKQQSSATYVFDTILQGTQLAAGGYSVLTGTMSLFGSENKDLQKTMVKLQSLIAITTGLQQIQNTVIGEGNILQRIAIVQTAAKTKAEALSTKGTITATIAQKAFNIVAYANPYVLLAIAIISVVGALYLFSRDTETAAEKQKRLNELQREAIDLQQQFADAIKSRSNQIIRQLERELELMQAQGVSEAQLALKRRQIAEERLTLAEKLENFYKDDIDNLDQNIRKAEDLKYQLQDINDQLKSGNKVVTVLIDSKIKRFDPKSEDFQNMKSGIEDELSNINLKIGNAQEVIEQVKDTNNQIDVLDANAQKRSKELGKKNAVALAQYRILIAKQGSEEELKAQIAAAETKLRVDLQNSEITKGERLKLARETELEIQRLRDEFNRKQLQDELEITKAGLSAAKEGSLEEYNLNLVRLAQQKKIELANRTLSVNQRLSIEAKYNKDVEDLTDKYLNNVASNEINTQISTLNARLLAVKEGSNEEYAIRVEIAEENARLQKQDVENTVKNEQLKAAKIKEINAQLAKDKKVILYDQETKNIERQYQSERLAISQQYEKGKLSKWKYEKELDQITINSLNSQIESRRKNGEDTLSLELELSQKRIEIAQQEMQARLAIAEEVFNTISVFSSLEYEGKKNRIQQELNDLSHYYTTDAEEAKKNKNVKLISETEYNKRQLDLKRKAAKAEKDEAIFNLALTNSQAVARAFKDFPWPISAVIAALVGLQTLRQYTAIKNKPLPKYWKGRKGGQGEFSLIGEQGPEIMYIPEGASIMPAHISRNAINGDSSAFSKWNMPPVDMKMPMVPLISQQLISDARKTYNTEIDYEKMGKAFAKYQKTAPAPKVSVNFDKDGLIISNNGNTTRFLNSKHN